MNAELNIKERSFRFAVRVVNLCKILETQDRVSKTLANQLLRSGTSIGAYYGESAIINRVEIEAVMGFVVQRMGVQV